MTNILIILKEIKIIILKKMLYLKLIYFFN
jgi:hypothetical protein